MMKAYVVAVFGKNKKNGIDWEQRKNELKLM